MPNFEAVVELVAVFEEHDVLKSIPLLGLRLFGNSLYAYLLTALSFGSLYVGLSVFRRWLLSQLSSTGGNGLVRVVYSIIARLNNFLLAAVAFHFSVQRLSMPTQVAKWIGFLIVTIVTVQSIRIVSKVLSFAITESGLMRGYGDEAGSRSFNNNIAALVRFGVWTAGLLFLLDFFGFNVSTFIAGLGIGGAAIALASQAILGDTFSSFAIALDKPFEVGDVIVVDTLMGTVEHIGLKTTRVRSVSGELLIFANSDLTKSRIRNYKQMYQRQVRFKIGVVYQTSHEKLQRVLEIVREAVASQPDAELERVHFQTFGDFSLVFEVAYLVKRPDYLVYMDVQQAINFYIFQAFSRDSIDMAYPTQTLLVNSTPQSMPTS
jgi:small-conductance mechanosensitive channel